MSGLALLKSSSSSLKCRLTANLSYSCRAISGSLSHTPTISHPLILWICDAWASAIFQHPTIAILSMLSFAQRTFEVPVQSFCHRLLRHPAPLRIQFCVTVICFLPLGMPSLPVEGRGQLSL